MHLIALLNTHIKRLLNVLLNILSEDLSLFLFSFVVYFTTKPKQILIYIYYLASAQKWFQVIKF